jgi:hypothetical protein
MGKTEVPLSLRFGGEWYRSRNVPPMRYGQVMSVGIPGAIEIRMPREAVERLEGELIVELYWAFERDEFRAILVPSSDPASATAEDIAWGEGRVVEDSRVRHGQLEYRTTYRIPDWRARLDPGERVVKFGVASWRVREENREDRRFRDAGIQTWGQYSATARFVPGRTVKETPGDWPQWQ